jgi:DNA-binding MarR family transcriptional regulator
MSSKLSDMPQAQDPRCLSAEEQELWFGLLAIMSRLPAALDAQLQDDCGLSMVEYEVLSFLSVQPDRTVRMSNLASFARVSLSHLSRIASRLEKRGWMRRTPDPVDGRWTLAVLTDGGWGKVVEAAPGHVETVRRHVFDPLATVQIDQLLSITERINGSFDGNRQATPTLGPAPRVNLGGASS